jgi:hypothetical protein
MAVKFSNNASTTLASAINTTATSITVTDASSFPTLGAGDYTYVTLDADTIPASREVVKVTAIVGNVLTVVRGQDGTSGTAFDAGVAVELRLTAALLNDVADLPLSVSTTAASGGGTLAYSAGVFTFAPADLVAADTSYDNTDSGLVASNVQSAIDEIEDKKLNISDMASNVSFYATTTASDIATYSKLVTTPEDADFDDTAVNVSTGSITTTDQLISSLASVAGILSGSTGIINIATIGNIRKTSGSGSADFYFEVYKRDSGGTETLIGTSSATEAIDNAIYEQFTATSLISSTAFTNTDRVVLKFYGNKLSGGSDPVYDFQFGGDAPVRTNFPVPVNVVSHANDAEDIIVDTANFAGILSGSDNSVQNALDTIDDHTHPLTQFNITATATELNYTDGVTSNIQTQLDGKEPADATILKDSDVGASVLAFDSNLQGFVTAFTLPVSDGTSGQALVTDGSGTIAFGDVDALPSQTGNDGKYLTTDGTTASWEEIVGATGAYTRTTATATSAQTVFNLAYTVGYVDVYLNGIKLDSSDFTATDGSSVVLTSSASAGDLFEAIAWNITSISQAYKNPDGGFANSVYTSAQSIDGGSA